MRAPSIPVISFLLAAGVAGLPSVASASVCATLRAELTSASTTPGPSAGYRRYQAMIDRQHAEIDKLEGQMRALGCSAGSIVVIGGRNTRQCDTLADLKGRMEANIAALADRRDAAGMAARPSPAMMQARLRDAGCLGGTGLQTASQFLDPVAAGSQTVSLTPTAATAGPDAAGEIWPDDTNGDRGSGVDATADQGPNIEDGSLPGYPDGVDRGTGERHPDDRGSGVTALPAPEPVPAIPGKAGPEAGTDASSTASGATSAAADPVANPVPVPGPERALDPNRRIRKVGPTFLPDRDESLDLRHPR